jgi:hypothetical protein
MLPRTLAARYRRRGGNAARRNLDGDTRAQRDYLIATVCHLSQWRQSAVACRLVTKFRYRDERGEKDERRHKIRAGAHLRTCRSLYDEDQGRPFLIGDPHEPSSHHRSSYWSYSGGRPLRLVTAQYRRAPSSESPVNVLVALNWVAKSAFVVMASLVLDPWQSQPIAL